MSAPPLNCRRGATQLAIVPGASHALPLEVVVRQRGSHVMLRRGAAGFVVRLHRETKRGTLGGILRQAGFAAVLRGSSLPTRDIGLVPSRSPTNLDRLAVALKRMNVVIRTDGDPVPAPLDGPFLANMPFMLTDLGEMDLTFAPSGGLGGFEEWIVHSIVVEIADGLEVRISALSDIIDSKRAANRPKDQRALPYLESLRDQIGTV